MPASLMVSPSNHELVAASFTVANGNVRLWKSPRARFTSPPACRWQYSDL